MDVNAGENKWTFKVKDFVPNVYVSALIIKDPHLDSQQAFLPGRAIGAPMSYEVGGRQFIALTVRGARGGPPELVALALP